MFFFRSKKRAVAAQIDGESITVEPGETLLKAALRQGLEFPHHCRIGACAVCKCRLLEGQVKALTDSSYVLSDAEIGRGYILACQCLPQTDVRIEVDRAAGRRVTGRVTGQVKLTHDITELRVQLNEPLPYKAGQFADIGIASLPDVKRSYSFATPSRSDGQVSFFVRKVPGGAFSSLIDGTDVIGQTVTVDGPKGGFWLRPADAPLLFVAGGSGLAPILAILEEAADAGVKRPASLLFGARKQKDLYALDTIAGIAARWRGAFRFVPVLSDDAGDGSWAGDRGMVVALVPRALAHGAHAYLCGPPLMIDSAVNLLSRQGVPRDCIHADRFTTAYEAPAMV
jgi:NAD(P)H-flavin reductase/ferredoxin